MVSYVPLHTPIYYFLYNKREDQYDTHDGKLRKARQLEDEDRVIKENVFLV